VVFRNESHQRVVRFRVLLEIRKLSKRQLSRKPRSTRRPPSVRSALINFVPKLRKPSRSSTVLESQRPIRKTIANLSDESSIVNCFW
jgi:hypothetical protein